MKPVKMRHKDDPSTEYSTVPQQSFDEHWSQKGWVNVDEPTEPEPKVTTRRKGADTEPDTNTQED